jgi:predicted HD phosphohydrolase
MITKIQLRALRTCHLKFRFATSTINSTSSFLSSRWPQLSGALSTKQTAANLCFANWFSSSTASTSTINSTSSFLSSRWPQLSGALSTKQTVPADIALSVIKECFNTLGREPYFGEPVTHEEHALQCATLAMDEGFEEDVVVAAFLHDIGHICAPEDAPHMDTDGGPDVGVVDHEIVGKELLAVLGFSKFVTDLVESHVPSKRYLVSTIEEYKQNLAEDSKRSLLFQGGFMTKEEVDSFNQEPMKDMKIQFREWDEKGKQPNFVTPKIEKFYLMVERHLRRQEEEKQRNGVHCTVKYQPDDQ